MYDNNYVRYNDDRSDTARVLVPHVGNSSSDGMYAHISACTGRLVAAKGNAA